MCQLAPPRMGMFGKTDTISTISTAAGTVMQHAAPEEPTSLAATPHTILHTPNRWATQPTTPENPTLLAAPLHVTPVTTTISRAAHRLLQRNRRSIRSHHRPRRHRPQTLFPKLTFAREGSSIGPFSTPVMRANNVQSSVVECRTSWTVRVQCVRNRTSGVEANQMLADTSW